eukprot:8188475-Heterocapsa_arctica.AAC.1
MFQLNNENTLPAVVKRLSWNPAIFFRRCRLIGGGQIVEDTDCFNRLSSMISSLESESEQLSIASEGFGSFDTKAGFGPVVLMSASGNTVVEEGCLPDNRKTFEAADHDASGFILDCRK